MPGLGNAIPIFWKKSPNLKSPQQRHFIYESQLRFDGPSFHTLCDKTIDRGNSKHDHIGSFAECVKCTKEARKHNADRS